MKTRIIALILGYFIFTSFVQTDTPLVFKSKELNVGTIYLKDTIKCFFDALNTSNKDLILSKIDSNHLEVNISVKNVLKSEKLTPIQLVNGQPVIQAQDSVFIFIEMFVKDTGYFQRMLALEIGNDKIELFINGRSVEKEKFTYEEYARKKEVECERLITREVDYSGTEIKYHSPMLYDQEIVKIISKADTSYYLSLRLKGEREVKWPTGVYVIFNDGTRLNWSDEKLKYDKYLNSHLYSAYVKLTKEDVSILSKRVIKKIRLNVFNKELERFEADNFRKYVNCLLCCF